MEENALKIALISPGSLFEECIDILRKRNETQSVGLHTE